MDAADRTRPGEPTERTRVDAAATAVDATAVTAAAVTAAVLSEAEAGPSQRQRRAEGR
jgi:hypothetical protein